ncbi:hypothetical protein JX265_002895 [Neoarthrinium moseri]|uniref:Uncharacterized protein n=1 Tax=Neoarthrinium moseri TaxID=1658444 RepID=A0A9P9WSV4_9PEZI|nr:hypothetical protein JX265_002895 [Neoarthrinium moseri]
MRSQNFVSIFIALVQLLSVGSGALPPRLPLPPAFHGDQALVVDRGPFPGASPWPTQLSCPPEKSQLHRNQKEETSIQRRSVVVDKADIDNALTRIRQSVADLRNVTDNVVVELLSVGQMLDNVQAVMNASEIASATSSTASGSRTSSTQAFSSYTSTSSTQAFSSYASSSFTNMSRTSSTSGIWSTGLSTSTSAGRQYSSASRNQTTSSNPPRVFTSTSTKSDGVLTVVPITSSEKILFSSSSSSSHPVSRSSSGPSQGARNSTYTTSHTRSASTISSATSSTLFTSMPSKSSEVSYSQDSEVDLTTTVTSTSTRTITEYVSGTRPPDKPSPSSSMFSDRVTHNTSSSWSALQPHSATSSLMGSSQSSSSISTKQSSSNGGSSKTTAQTWSSYTNTSGSGVSSNPAHPGVQSSGTSPSANETVSGHSGTGTTDDNLQHRKDHIQEFGYESARIFSEFNKSDSFRQFPFQRAGHQLFNWFQE